MKKILAIGGIALGVFFILNRIKELPARANVTGGKPAPITAITTDGEELTLRNVGGFIIDQRGRTWL